MFDSTALLGLFRPFRPLSGDRRGQSFWVCRATELVADWVFIVALLVAIYAVTAEIAAVALFMLLRLTPRAVVVAAFHDRAARIGADGLFLLSLPRVPLIASLALVGGRSDLVWAGAVVVAYGLMTALTNEARAAMLPALVPRTRLAGVIQLNAAVERIAFVGGPLLAALALWAWNADGAFIVSAFLLIVTSLLLGIRARTASDAALVAAPVFEPVAVEPAWNAVRRQPALLLLAGGLFAGAALAICLKVVLVELATGPLERSDAALGLLLALVGVGTLVGPLSVSRLLGHFPLSMIVTGSIVGIAAGIVLISAVTRLEIVVIALLGIGMISITNDLVTATAMRRLTPEAGLLDTGRLMHFASIAGQLSAAVAVALLAMVWDVTDVMLAVGVACGLLMAILFVLADGLSVVTRRLARS